MSHRVDDDDEDDLHAAMNKALLAALSSADQIPNSPAGRAILKRIASDVLAQVSRPERAFIHILFFERHVATYAVAIGRDYTDDEIDILIDNDWRDGRPFDDVWREVMREFPNYRGKYNRHAS